MELTVLLFASYAEALGSDRLVVPLPDGALVGDVVHHLLERAGPGRLPPRPMVAVNRRYARYDQPLELADEVAIIPPVAGG